MAASTFDPGQIADRVSRALAAAGTGFDHQVVSALPSTELFVALDGRLIRCGKQPGFDPGHWSMRCAATTAMPSAPPCASSSAKRDQRCYHGGHERGSAVAGSFSLREPLFQSMECRQRRCGTSPYEET